MWPALLAALLLAGCGALAPPPAPGASPPPPGDDESPPPPPAFARGDCLQISLDAAWPPHVEVSHEEGATFHVRLTNDCDEPLEILPGGACPADLLRVELRDGRARGPPPTLRGHGAALESGVPCPPDEPGPPLVLWPSFTLSRTYEWNGTLARPCPEGPGCVEHRRAEEGHHEVVVTAYLPHPEIGRTAKSASWSFFVRPYCVTLTLADPPRAPEDVRVTIAGREAERTWEQPARLRWCGERGEHEVRYEDVRQDIRESANLTFEEPELVLRHSPLRVELPERWWVYRGGPAPEGSPE